MKKDSFNCDSCGESIKYSDVGNAPYKDGGKPICDDCHSKHFMQVCPLCQDEFSNKITTPKKYYFVIMPEDSKETGFKPGIYRGKQFPIWRSDMFTVDILDSSVELIRGLGKDILNSEFATTDRICPECYNKYTNEEWLKLRLKTNKIEAIYKEAQMALSKIVNKNKGDVKYFGKIFAPSFNSMSRIQRRAYLKSNKIAINCQLH